MNACSVAIYDGFSVWDDHVVTDRGQAEMLLPMVNSVVARSNVSYADIGCVGVITGPGSFTGLRVALSAARSIGLSLNKPVLGLSTFDVLMQQGVAAGKKADDLFYAVDTRRGDYYTRCGSRDPVIMGADEVLEVLNSGRFHGVGDFGPELMGHAAVLSDVRYPDMPTLARWADGQYLAQNLVGSGYNLEKAPQPFYMRGAEISQSKRIFHTLGE